jgi:hypothetical protein
VGEGSKVMGLWLRVNRVVGVLAYRFIGRSLIGLSFHELFWLMGKHSGGLP